MFNWLSFMTYAFVTAVTPGPNNIMSMSHAGRLGFKKSFPFNLGIWCGFSIVMLLCALFCRLLASLIPEIKTPMLLVGSLYMLYLAWQTYRSGSDIEDLQGQSGFVPGLTLQFVNIKIYIYGIVSMEAYVLPLYSDNVPILVFFALLLAFIGFVCTLLWSGFGAAFRSLFSTHAKTLNRVMALLLVYCALSLFLNQRFFLFSA